MGRPSKRRTRASALAVASDEQLRRRVALELRNSTLQAASALTINLGVIKRIAAFWPAAAQTAMSECLQLAEQCQREIRIFSYLLYPSLLDEFGLHSTLSGYLSAFEKRNGCKIVLKMNSSFRRRLPQHLELILFRSVQEFLASIESKSKILHEIHVHCQKKLRQVSLEVTAEMNVQSGERKGRRVRNLDPGLLEILRRVKRLGGEMVFIQEKGRRTMRVVVSLS